jgi:hypothetical protein
MLMRKPWSRLVVLAALLTAGCSTAPEISIPQLEGARRAVEEPRGERTDVYQQCLQQALTPPPGNKAVLMQCMRDHGYGFLAKTVPHRVDHCLQMRQTEGKFPEDFCFQKTD